MEELSKALNTKLELLQLKATKGKAIADKGIIETTQRHCENLRTLSKEVNELKLRIEQEKVSQGEKVSDISDWSEGIDIKLEEVDRYVNELGDYVNKATKQADLEAGERALDIQRVKQLAFERAQLELKLEFDRKAEELKTAKSKPESSKVKAPTAKLPKLSITKFDGTYEQWLPFWNKYEAEIVDLPPVTKFAYLKELLVPKVRANIDELPFTTEGYERAKNILKSEYGKLSEVVHAYVNNIMGLPTITSSCPKKIDEFYRVLRYNVQSLETLGKLKEISGNTRAVLDKLKGIKAELVRGENTWQDWDFSKLLNALKIWKEINVIEDGANLKGDTGRRIAPSPRVGAYQAQQKIRACVYCDSQDHRSVNCTKHVNVDARKKILASKHLCFNCTGGKHRASECKSRSCTCGQRHHTSICNKEKRGETLMTAQPEGCSKVIYPIVVVEVQGVKCRALLDTGAGSSYASAALLDLVKARPTQSQIRTIEMMLGAQTKKVELYTIKVDSVSEDCSLKAEVTRVEKPQLLEIENPGYAQLIQQYPHLKNVNMDDNDTKLKLPVHLILGASEFSKIKKNCAPCIGNPGDPVAEYTSFGWTIMSPGEETDVSKALLTQTSQTDYEALCKMDILGLKDPMSNDQQTVYSEFKEQLKQNPEGWYETGLPWKGDMPFLPNNKAGSLRRLDTLVRKLDKSGMIDRYHDVIQSQLEEGIVERVTDPPVGTEFYIPHKAVVRESAESTKLRVVYDASARAHDQAPSLNACLHTGPPLQNLLWAVLVRNRFHPVVVQGDIKQAFLQVRIREAERDALRFHWLSDLESRRVEVLRFTRALFGLAPSPFLLAGVLQQHLESVRGQYPEIVEEIERSLYVDDLIGGGPSLEAAQEIKSKSTSILSKAAFTLHKWHSNMPELEAQPELPTADVHTYAKQQLGIPEQGKGAILGLSWNKSSDTVTVRVQDEGVENTKRGILRKMAKVYDPLGVVSPTTLGGKLVYREVCDNKIPWDKPLPESIMKVWSKWEQSLPKEVSMPRSIPKHREPITEITLHGFGDASGKGVSAAVYAVVEQESGVSVGLVTAKARLAKRGLSIPRLELVSGHMAVNLTVNVGKALQGFPVRELHCWLDSSVALHWIRGAGEYKQFVHNRVEKIKAHKVKWHHVSSKENPADLGSRSSSVEESKLWWQGPAWLTDRANWPPDIITTASTQSQVEAKVIREIFATAMANPSGPDQFDTLLSKFILWKVLRIEGWVFRFIHNAKVPRKRRIHGPLTPDELGQTRLFWEKRAQGTAEGKEHFEEDRLQLNLQKNSNGVYECRGRIQGFYPVYIPDDHPYAIKLVEQAHLESLHGGVSLTMAKVREFNWIPRLRRLAKKTLKDCNRCRRYHAKALESPPPGTLPKDRSEGNAAFKVVGVDYAGPFRYKKKKNVEGKAYLLLYACSLTRALYLELLPTLETSQFLSSFKRFVARRGRPDKIYSDNGRTFTGAANWLKKAMKDERCNDFMVRHKIKWQFNLSRAPWWGGQFERMVGLVKRSLSKCIGNGYLTFTEFQEVVLDVEVALNNRPLCYIEDDIQLPVLMPSTFLFDQPNILPERETHHEENKDLRRRAKYLKRCKDVVWQRWTCEYLRALRERHRLKYNGKEVCPKIGEVVLIKSEQKDRGKWKIGIVQKLFSGRDGVVRAVELKVGASQLQRAIQHLYPLELSCDLPVRIPGSQLNADAQSFNPRVTRAAAREAKDRITAVAVDENE